MYEVENILLPIPPCTNPLIPLPNKYFVKHVFKEGKEVKCGNTKSMTKLSYPDCPNHKARKVANNPYYDQGCRKFFLAGNQLN